MKQPEFDKVIEELDKIREERSEKYKDSWKDLDIGDYMSLIKIKLLRLNYLTKDNKQQDATFRDSAVDLVNYGIWLIAVLNEGEK